MTTAPDYERFSSASVGPDGLGMEHYAKHEIWVRWLTAYAELCDVADAAAAYMKKQGDPNGWDEWHALDMALARRSAAEESDAGA